MSASASGASRRSDVPAFQVMEVLKAVAERERTHGDVILLCVGQPSTPAPVVARRAMAAAFEDDVLGYSEAVGRRATREAVAEYYGRVHDAAVDADEVIITTGSSGGFTLAMLAAFDPGDAVVMARPGYPAYRNTMRALGIEVLELECGPERGFQPDIEQLDALAVRPRGLVVASPANPTGTVIEPERLRQLVDWCEANDCLLVSDEIYHGISYGARCVSARALSSTPLVVGSLSKYFSMTGYRVGWLLAPRWLAPRLELLQGNLSICAPVESQVGAAAALDERATDELDGHVARYTRNREALLGRLDELGVHRIAPPDGAFYVYADVSDLTDDSLRWCADALAATGVALAPGIDFDPLDGHRYVRISFCGSLDDLHEGIDRLVSWIGGS